MLELLEIKEASKKELIKQTTSKYIVKHSSEWHKEVNMADVFLDIFSKHKEEIENSCEIDDHYKKQKERIDKLSFFKDCKDIEEFPKSDDVYHINPIGLVGVFGKQSKCLVDIEYFITMYEKEFSTILKSNQKKALEEVFKGISDFYSNNSLYSCSKERTAYMLATAKHETAHTFEPITEYGAKSYFNKYDPILADSESRRKRAVKMENTKEGDGYKYRGRGFVQLTWKKNYRKAGTFLNLDLINSPELALEHYNAIQIMIWGMEEGIFTGKSFSNYFSNENKDYYNARRIINGTDKASQIEKYAEKIEKCIK